MKKIFCNQKLEKVRDREKMDVLSDFIPDEELKHYKAIPFPYKEMSLLLAYDTRIVSKNDLTEKYGLA